MRHVDEIFLPHYGESDEAYCERLEWAERTPQEWNSREWKTLQDRLAAVRRKLGKADR